MTTAQEEYRVPYLHGDGGGGQRGGRGQAGLSRWHCDGGGTDDLAGQGGDGSQCGDGCDQGGIGAVHGASGQAGGCRASDSAQGGDTCEDRRGFFQVTLTVCHRVSYSVCPSAAIVTIPQPFFFYFENVNIKQIEKNTSKQKNKQNSAR